MEIGKILIDISLMNKERCNSMATRYTKQELIEQLEIASQNMSLFYKQGFINYTGQTICNDNDNDTGESYSEVICSWLLDNLDLFNRINCISREKSYFTPTHKGIPPTYDSNREEELIAMAIFRQHSFKTVGKIIDYQIPLKNKRSDEAGKIDLLSYDGKIARILELKKPDSKETMLRCVLEGYTYLRTVDEEGLISSFRFNKETIMKANPLVFYDGFQHQQVKSDKYPKLRELIKVLDTKPYYIKILGKEKYEIITENL